MEFVIQFSDGFTDLVFVPVLKLLLLQSELLGNIL